MFRLTHDPIEAALLLPSDASGATIVFEGTVRDLNEGLEVQGLTYEAKESLALREGGKILSEAMQRHALLGAACVHRLGSLQIGEVAIRVEVQAMHRSEAFAACRFIVDEVKARVPIWKKEHYRSGDSGWVNCHIEGGFDSGRSVEDLLAGAYYERQIRLKEVGRKGQDALAASKVLVVGAGGLGSSALQYLAAAGVGSITICDSDHLETSNLHRQTLYDAADFGKPKAALAANRLRALNPLIEIQSRELRVTDANAGQLVSPYDLVLDCTDNFPAKFALNDACVSNGVALAHASIYQFEGQLLFVEPGSPSGCLRCVWPEVPPTGCVGSCAEVGVLGAVPGVFGALQAMAALAWLLGSIPVSGRHSLTLLDLTTLSVRHVARKRNPSCPVCGSSARKSEPLEIADVHSLPDARLVDIRESFEGETIAGALRIPMSRFALEPLPNGQLILVCAHGVRSYALAAELRSVGKDDVYSLSGGIASL